MKVLSLFDGMACGALALQAAGVEIESYDAFEIDKYATKTASHNFPFIKHHGDVFEADFTEFEGVDLVCGGSPCTYWSIAQKNNRETEASGLGWELFQQYVRAVKEAKPKYFIYENNKSMSKAIRASIDEAFGFEAVLINSALVSAQSRQRLYWVGRRNPDGTYSKVNVEQPEDRGIVLRDILESGTAWREKSYCLDANYYKASNGTTPCGRSQSSQRMCVAEPINITDNEKSQVLKANYYKSSVANFFNGNDGMKYAATGVAEPVRIPPYGNEDKARPLNALYPNNCGGFEHRMFSENPNKQQVDMVAEPVGIGYRGRMEDGKWVKQYESNGEPKVNALTTAQTDSMVADPIRIGTIESDLKNPKHDSKQYRVYSPDGKATTLCGQGGGVGAKTGLYACPSSKGSPIYEVKDGFITIKGKQYPIKLKDRFYIIRKLTVRECMRLQTVPEWYEFPVSNSQAYKMLGNGWTVEVIAHLIKSCLTDKGDAQPELE